MKRPSRLNIAEPINSQVIHKRVYDGPHDPRPYQKLKEAELVYLRATGWVEHAPESWSHEGRGRRNISQGHAVNVQKQFDRGEAPIERSPV